MAELITPPGRLGSIPTLTVCIPAYKAERYLAETLNSVRAQTFTQWELVLVEDGSRDGTEQIVRDFAAGGTQRVEYIRHERNQGLSATRNTGFQHARTDLLAILDADDLWHPNHLQLCLATLEASSADLVFSGCELFDSDTGAKLEARVPPPGSMRDFPLSLHAGQILIQPSTVLLRRRLLEKGGFNPAFPICNDVEFWFRLAKSGTHFAYTGEITCDYRKHGTALSARSADLIAELGQIHALHRDWPGIPAQQRHHEMLRHHLSAARMYLRVKPLRSLQLVVQGLIARISS